jgi:hypothetical protein
VLFISAVKVSEVLLFAGLTVRYFHGGLLYKILHIICKLKEDCLLEFSPLLGFSRVNSCACVRFYLSTSSTSVHHFRVSILLVDKSNFV